MENIRELLGIGDSWCPNGTPETKIISQNRTRKTEREIFLRYLGGKKFYLKEFRINSYGIQRKWWFFGEISPISLKLKEIFQSKINGKNEKKKREPVTGRSQRNCRRRGRVGLPLPGWWRLARWAVKRVIGRKERRKIIKWGKRIAWLNAG